MKPSRQLSKELSNLIGFVPLGETHHHAPNSRIMSYVRKARKARLENRSNSAVYALANGLHFVHDRATGKGSRGSHHDAIEAAVADLPIPEDAIRLGFEQARSHPLAVERVVSDVKPSNEPERILWNAAFASAWLVQAVFDFGDVAKAKREVQENLRKRKRDFVVGIVAFVAAVLIGLIFWTIIPVIIGLLAFIPSLKDNSRIGKLCQWFALKDIKAVPSEQRCNVVPRKSLALFTILCIVPVAGLVYYAITPSLLVTYNAPATVTSTVAPIQFATSSRYVHTTYTMYTTTSVCYNPYCYTYTKTAKIATPLVTIYATSSRESSQTRLYTLTVEKMDTLTPYAAPEKGGYIAFIAIIGTLFGESLIYALIVRHSKPIDSS